MSTAWMHFNPVRLVIKASGLDHLHQHMAPGTWLLITSNGSVSRGVVQKIINQLSKYQSLVICDLVQPNPELSFIESLLRQYKCKVFDGILAIGGGSVIDVAKILAVALGQEGLHLAKILHTGIPQNWSCGLPLIAIPTTAGTGSEVTPFATVWDQETHRKFSVVGDHLYPKLALLDPCLTVSLPRQQTLYTGLDATSHALESLWNINRTPLSQIYAQQALQFIVSAFSVVLSDPNNVQGRIAMQYGSVLAGLAISQTRTAIAHSISYPVTSYYGVPHGLACSFTLPALIESNLSNFDGSQKALLIQVHALLSSLRLDREISRYVNVKELLLQTSQMQLSGRADNYPYSIDLQDILKRSISDEP